MLQLYQNVLSQIAITLNVKNSSSKKTNKKKRKKLLGFDTSKINNWGVKIKYLAPGR